MRCFLLSFALLLASILPMLGQTKLITGTVVDEYNEPLIGATVAVTGTQLATMTDVDGNFTLSVSDNSKNITVTYVGMETADVAISPTMKIVMKYDSKLLGEVVSVGYYQKKPGAITGAIGVVAKDVLKQPVVNVTQMLQGSTPGVFSVSSSGKPNAGADIQIRGVGSINSSTEPLYILDGVPVSSSDFTMINAGDIENITVLKDASATALYGSRGSNGVVLVQTKRGSEGSTVVTYRGQVGFSKLSEGNIKMMNTSEKLQYETLTGLIDASSIAGQSLIADRMRYDNKHMDEVFRTPFETSHEVSLRGGNEKTQFFMSVGYLSKEGIIRNSDFSRITGSANVDHQINKMFKVGTSFFLAQSDDASPITPDATGAYGWNDHNPVVLSLRLNPYENLKDDNGDYIPYLSTYQTSNPLREAGLMSFKDKAFNLRNSTYLEVNPIEKLKLRSSVGFTINDLRNKQYASPLSQWGSEPKGYATRSSRHDYSIIQNNQANYTLELDKHTATFIVGTEILKEKNEMLMVQARKVYHNSFTELSQYGEVFPNGWGSGFDEHTMASFYGIVNYDYENKYFLDLSVRRDGSSRLSKDNRWSNFWAVGAQWNMKREKFLEDIHILSGAKLRASVGTQGNSNVGNYVSQRLYGVQTYLGNPAITLSNFGNNDLTWEKTTSFDVGADVSFLNSKYRASIDFYRRNTKDLFFNVPTTHTSGLSSILKNAGEMYNQGIEVSVGADIYSDKDWTVGIDANLSVNKNKVTKLYSGVNQLVSPASMSILKEGESYGQFYAVRWAGVNPVNGDPLWYDKNGDVTNVYSADDAVILDGKNFFPNKTAGFTINTAYKGFALQAMFSSVWDKWIANNTLWFIEYDYGEHAGRYNHTQQSLDTWSKPGDITEFPRVGSSNMRNVDSRLIHNQSFLRLKNLTVSYNLNAKTLKPLRFVRSARVYAMGQNLWTITNYRGLDPEVSGYIDEGTYPASRTFTFGVELSF